MPEIMVERTTRVGSDGQVVYGMTITEDYRNDDNIRMRNFFNFFYIRLSPFLYLFYIIASVTFLVLSKQKQNKLLRAWIIGILSAAVAELATSAWYAYYFKGYSHLLSTYNLNMILDGKTPVKGYDLFVIRLFTRLETPSQWLSIALTYFGWAWVIVGCVLILKERSFRFDAPHLYWLAVSVAVTDGIESVIQIFLAVATRSCYPV